MPKSFYHSNPLQSNSCHHYLQRLRRPGSGKEIEKETLISRFCLLSTCGSDCQLSPATGADGMIASMDRGRGVDSRRATIGSLLEGVGDIGGETPMLVDGDFWHGADF